MKGSDLEKGLFIMYKDEPHLILDREFVSPGKGSAFCRLRLRNCINGSTQKDIIFKASETTEEADVTSRSCQFQYSDDSVYFFMDNSSFEQYEIPRAGGFEDKVYYMEEGDVFDISFWGDRPLDITIPKKKAFIIKDSPEALKGDTATSVTKTITTTTGLKVKAPGFLKEGEKILVNTETNEYVERVNEK